MKAIPNNYLFSKSDLKKLIIPLLAEQFFIVIVGFIDSVMVASAGEVAVSGVMLINNVFAIPVSFLGALATGGAVVIGKYIGMKKNSDACDSAKQMLVLTTAVSVVLTVAIYLLRNVILYKLYGAAEKDVLVNADIYLLIVGISFPFLGVYNAGAAIFRSNGDSKTPMNISVAMNLINILGNAILIYGFKMGVAGVAIPTLISRIFAAVAVMIKVNDDKIGVYIDTLKGFKLDMYKIKQMLGIGIPNSVESCLSNFGQIIITTVVVSFGTASVAASTIAGNIGCFSKLAGAAMAQALLTVASQCEGASDREQLDFYVKRLMKLSYLMLIMSSVVIVLILPFILRVYNLSAEATSLARICTYMDIVTVCIFYPAAIEYPTVLKAMNDAMFTMVVGLVSMWIFNIALCVVFGQVLGFGLVGGYIAGAAWYIVRSIMFTARYKSRLRLK